MCVPQNNSDGHYTCDPFTGSRVCLEGYRDPSNGCVTPAEEEEEEGKQTLCYNQCSYTVQYIAPPQFSRLGTQGPASFCVVVCAFCMYLGGGGGGGGGAQVVPYS